MSKTLFDVFKIQVAAAYASKFFAEFAIMTKIAMIGTMIVTGVLAFLIYPKKEKREDG